MAEQIYVGSELDLFAKAVRWKSYYRSHLARFIRGDVLEVGAGIGGTTPVLHSSAARSWVCLEPDPGLAVTLREVVQRIPVGPSPRVVVGSLTDLDATMRFDSILYIDVLEHIEHDREEIANAAARLRPGGSLIVLSPAHQCLYTPFDRDIGHFRRYDKRSLRNLQPKSLHEERCSYLDSAGTVLSLANRMILRSGSPTQQQILLWDRYVIPVSRVFDRFLGYRFGKSIFIVWRHPG